MDARSESHSSPSPRSPKLTQRSPNLSAKQRTTTSHSHQLKQRLFPFICWSQERTELTQKQRIEELEALVECQTALITSLQLRLA
mmetsp:Transcript_40609/g.81442  ORF Transcript_40609/g.81442 Transcript_40609/m.81442 type:complete len:85 (-) Transcript_40609:95-349(-)